MFNKNYSLGCLAVILVFLGSTVSMGGDRLAGLSGVDLYRQNFRAVSMGNAFTAVAKSADTALEYNPAGLATVFKDKWAFAIGANVDVRIPGNARKIADDVDDMEGESDPYVIDDFVSKYEDDIFSFGSRIDLLYMQYQLKKPFDSQKNWLDRLGIGIHGHAGVDFNLSFPDMSTSSINTANKSKEEIADQIDSVLKKEFKVTLNDDEKEKLEEEIGGMDRSDLAAFDKVVNRTIKKGISVDFQAYTRQSGGIAIATQNEKLKLGVSLNQYYIIHRNPGTYSLAEGIAQDIDFEEKAPEETSSGTTFDLGAIYSFDNFWKKWNPQLGFTWQDVGGLDFGKDVNVEIVDTINMGGSLTRNYGWFQVIAAMDFTDITDNSYKRDSDGDTVGRSFSQRTHIGLELGFWEAAAMENHYIYLRGGLNQGQPCYGVELSLPWNLVRVGYSNWGLDMGNSKDSDTTSKEIVFVSLGLVI